MKKSTPEACVQCDPNLCMCVCFYISSSEQWSSLEGGNLGDFNFRLCAFQYFPNYSPSACVLSRKTIIVPIRGVLSE